MLLVLFAASGGHWMALQSLAWTRMFLSYSRDGQIAAAVAKTFDGRHPCSLCKQVEKSKQTEPQPTRDIEVESLAAFVEPTPVVVMRAEGVSWKLKNPEWRGEIRAEQPTAPPPRGEVA
jgi:hypothetical protein